MKDDHNIKLFEIINKQNNEYDLSKMIFINQRTPIIIISKTYNTEHSILPYNILSRNGFECNIRNAIDKTTFLISYIKHHKLLHEDCNYDKVKYVLPKTKIIITDENGFDHLITPTSIINRNTKLTLQSVKSKTKYLIFKGINKYKDKFKYKSYSDKSISNCKIHGNFKLSTEILLYNKGCPKCAHNYKISEEDFVALYKKSKSFNPNYEFSEFEYKHTEYKSVVINKELNTKHLINPYNLLNHSKNVLSLINAIDKNDYCIKYANTIHNNLYDYSEFNYVGINIDTIIKCHIHGVFMQTYHRHINSQGCPKCSSIKRNNAQINTTNYFIKKSIEKHGNMYNYTKSIYITAKNKLIIICNKHGEFEQQACNHLTGRGCPKCKSSKGELKIINYLENNNIKYETQKRFDKCKNILPLPFDFYINEYNLLIEFNGEQHYSDKNYFGLLKDVKKRDKIKLDFAKKYGFNYLIIKYDKYNRIDDILNKKINKINATK